MNSTSNPCNISPIDDVKSNVELIGYGSSKPDNTFPDFNNIGIPLGMSVDQEVDFSPEQFLLPPPDDEGEISIDEFGAVTVTVSKCKPNRKEVSDIFNKRDKYLEASNVQYSVSPVPPKRKPIKLENIKMSNTHEDLIDNNRKVSKDKPEDAVTIMESGKISDDELEILLEYFGVQGIDPNQQSINLMTVRYNEAMETIALLEKSKAAIEERHSSLKEQVKEPQVPFPITGDALGSLNKKYLPELSFNEELAIADDYDKLRSKLEPVYFPDGLRKGVTIPVTELLAKCPTRKSKLLSRCINDIINANMRDLDSNLEAIRSRENNNVVGNEFIRGVGDNWIDDVDVDFYVNEIQHNSDRRGFLTGSIADIHNRSGEDISMTLKVSDAQMAPSIVRIADGNNCMDAFYDSFNIDKSKYEDKTYMLELITLTPTELNSLAGRLPSKLSKELLYGHSGGLNIHSSNDDSKSILRYDVLVVTMLDTKSMGTNLPFKIRSWSVASVWLNTPDEIVKIPRTDISYDIRHKAGNEPFILFQHIQSGGVVQRRSIEDHNIDNNTVRISERSWTLLGGNDVCVCGSPTLTVVSEGDPDFLTTLTDYGLSHTRDLPVDQKSNSTLRGKIRSIQKANQVELKKLKESSKSKLKKEKNTAKKMLRKMTENMNKEMHKAAERARKTMEKSELDADKTLSTVVARSVADAKSLNDSMDILKAKMHHTDEAFEKKIEATRVRNLEDVAKLERTYLNKITAERNKYDKLLAEERAKGHEVKRGGEVKLENAKRDVKEAKDDTVERKRTGANLMGVAAIGMAVVTFFTGTLPNAVIGAAMSVFKMGAVM